MHITKSSGKSIRHRRTLARAGWAILAVIIVTMGPFAYGSASVRGMEPVSAVDGDTVQIGAKLYDLHGIDAPELGQLCRHGGNWTRCGVTAAFELKKLLDFDEPLRCEPAPANPEEYICHAASVDVAIVLLRAGYGVAAPGSSIAYRVAEKSAREGNLGLWHMEFVRPWNWRAGQRLPGASEASEAAPCPVRGVIDARGRKLYYVPTDKEYRTISVDRAKGERLFCSDLEARKAGWLRPGEMQSAR